MTFSKKRILATAGLCAVLAFVPAAAFADDKAASDPSDTQGAALVLPSTATPASFTEEELDTVVGVYSYGGEAHEITARQAIEDSRICMSHIGVGITHTVGESCVPQVLAEYCNQTPGVHINIVTDTIKNLYDMMRSYELDVAIVDGQFPASGYTEVLLDTDYLCLVVSPIHPLARRASVAIGALQGERFIMRPKGAGTRSMFESYLSECGADIRDFNIIIEMDSVATIKELVAQDLGISVIAHSACREDEQAGRLAVVPLEKPGMVRRINMVHHQDFSHPEILEELRRLYIGRR